MFNKEGFFNCLCCLSIEKWCENGHTVSSKQFSVAMAYHKTVVTVLLKPSIWLEGITHWGLGMPMATQIWVNIVLCNGLLPDGTKPLPDPMFTYHQWGPLIFIWDQFHEIPQPSIPKIRLKIPYLKFQSRLPGTNELIMSMCPVPAGDLEPHVGSVTTRQPGWPRLDSLQHQLLTVPARPARCCPKQPLTHHVDQNTQVRDHVQAETCRI